MINMARRIMLGAITYLSARVYGLNSQTISSEPGGFVELAGGGFVLCGQTVSGSQIFGCLVKFPSFSTATPDWNRTQSKGTGTARMEVDSGGTLVGADSSDNVYQMLRGYANGGSIHLPHIFKYNSSGAIQAQRSLSSATEAGNLGGLAVTSAGDCFMAFTINATNAYGAIAKYNSALTLQWQRKISSAFRVQLNACALTHDGGVVAVGFFYDGANSQTNSRGIVVKWNASGVLQWQFKIHLAETGQWDGVAVDQSNGDIYLSGKSGSLGVFAKLDSAGNVSYCRKNTTNGDNTIRSIAVDPATGWIYIGYCNNAGDKNTIMGLDMATASEQWQRSFLRAVTNSPSMCQVGVGSEQKAYINARAVSAVPANEILFAQLPSESGGSTATSTYTVTKDAAHTFTAPTLTKASAGLTDAAGTLTDAAGTATDAAGATTFNIFNT